jgi:hypothetical protein
MSESSQDAGVIQALLERLNSQRLPRALTLKSKVDAGEPLSDYDIDFLNEVFTDSEYIKPFIDRHPEYQDLIAHLVRLYKEIMDKAMENEKKT